jgi:pyridoxamine 5'-phosphate oxidase
VVDIDDVDPDPIVQFERWFAEAVEADEFEPEAMCVATAMDGLPSARMVLLKSVDQRGFVFYTNYESQKGRELAANPSAALVFRWVSPRRQVRVSGRAERVSEQESDAYFGTRDRGSQMSAWASAQSTVLPDRAALERRMAEMEYRFADRPVPRPPWWGGVRVVPDSIEFWQGRPSRLHDRLRYTRNDQGWRIDRLSP